MKKLFNVTIVAAGLFLAGNSVNAQQKIGHINSAELLQAMPEVKTADATFQAFQKNKQTQLEQMDAERQKKVNTYQEKYKTLSEANKATLSVELETLGKEIQDMEQRIRETEQKAQEELKTKQAELYQPIFTKAQEAVKAVGKEKGYAYVFDISQPGVVYFDGGEDLLSAVKAKLGITGNATSPATTTNTSKPNPTPAKKK